MSIEHQSGQPVKQSYEDLVERAKRESQVIREEELAIRDDPRRSGSDRVLDQQRIAIESTVGVEPAVTVEVERRSNFRPYGPPRDVLRALERRRRGLQMEGLSVEE